MARTRIIRSRNLPYHLYGRANNREWFYLPLDQVWEIFLRHLRKAIEERGLLVHAFVLMSNHYHLLATASDLSVDEVMCRLLKGISDEINRRAGRINHVFGGPYRWTLIKDWFQYHHVLRYIYQNPVRAGLCSGVADYSFSTVKVLKAPSFMPSPHPFEKIALRRIQNLGHQSWLSWFDEIYDVEHVEGIRRALFRRQFKFCANRSSRRIPKEFNLKKLTK